MAGEWLKFECTLPEKAETLAITVAMGWDDPDLTVGKLMRLFRWFDQQTVDGNAPSVTPALLDRIIGVSGFVTAVASVGWLVIEDGAIHLHNFDRHNGATAKSRALGAKRTAKSKSNAVGNGEGNAPTVTEASPREEKRREEISTDVLMPSAGEICKAMKTAGLVTGVSPSHPKLLALIAAGVTVAEFTDAATEAVSRQKPFAYALATAEGRRRDAATEALPPAASADPDRREAIEAEGIAKGIGAWDGIEQFHIYKARVRGGRGAPSLDLNALAGLAAHRAGAH